VGVFYSEDYGHTLSLAVNSLAATGNTLRIGITRSVYYPPPPPPYSGLPSSPPPPSSGPCGLACPWTPQYVLVTVPKAAVKHITRLVVAETDTIR
jgi:hypothetical protein